MSFEFFAGLGCAIFVMLLTAVVYDSLCKRKESEEEEELMSALETSLNFLVLYYLQPDHVNRKGVEDFLVSLGEIEEVEEVPFVQDHGMEYPEPHM